MLRVFFVGAAVVVAVVAVAVDVFIVVVFILKKHAVLTCWRWLG
jgi:hypothetical protein